MAHSVFTVNQIESGLMSLLIAKKLISMQNADGSFVYGYIDNKAIVEYNMEAHFKATNALLLPMTRKAQLTNNFINYPESYIITIDNAIKWGMRRAKEAPHKTYLKAKIIDNTNIDATSAALIAVSNMIEILILNKYISSNTWDLEGHSYYINYGDYLAQGLLSNMDKHGSYKVAGNQYQVLAALFLWASVCNKIWAWYQRFDIIKKISYSKQSQIHNYLAHIIGEPIPELIWPVACALDTNKNPNPNVKYLDTLVACMAEAKAPQLLLGLQAIGNYAPKKYKIIVDAALAKADKYLDNAYSRVMKSGAVKDKAFSYYDINLMQRTLTLSTLHANYLGLG